MVTRPEMREKVLRCPAGSTGEKRNGCQPFQSFPGNRCRTGSGRGFYALRMIRLKSIPSDYPVSGLHYRDGNGSWGSWIV